MIQKSNVKRFLGFVYKNNRKKVISSTILVIIVTLIDLYLPLVIKKIVYEGIMNNNLNMTIKFLLIFAVFSAVSILLDFFLGYLYTLMRNNIAIKVRVKLMKHISLLSGRYYSNKKTGNLLSIIQSDVDIVENVDTELMLSMVKNILTAFTALYFMIMINLNMFFWVLIFQLMIVMLQRVFTKKFIAW